jgi:hypothetical protein
MGKPDNLIIDSNQPRKLLVPGGEYFYQLTGKIVAVWFAPD